MSMFDAVRSSPAYQERRQAAMTSGVTTQEGGAVPQPTQTGGGGSAQDAIAYIQSRQAQLPPTPESTTQIYNELKQRGFQVEQPTHAQGTKISADKLVLPGGVVYDIIGGVDGGNPKWTTQQAGYWNEGKAYDDPNFQVRSGANSGMGPGAGGFSTSGVNNLASFSAPGLLAPWTQEFQAPTGTDDPGFQFAMDKGLEYLDRSKAANGTLLTGGAIKDGVDYVTGMSLQGYGDAWNRKFNVHNMNKGTFFQNQDNAYNKLAGAATLGAGAAENAANAGMQGANANATATATNAKNQASLYDNLSKFGMSAYEEWKKRQDAQKQMGAGAATAW